MSNYDRLTSLYNRIAGRALEVPGETPRETANLDETALSAAMDLIDALIADYAGDTVLSLARDEASMGCFYGCAVGADDDVTHNRRCVANRRLVDVASAALKALTDEPGGEA